MNILGTNGRVYDEDNFKNCHLFTRKISKKSMKCHWNSFEKHRSIHLSYPSAIYIKFVFANSQTVSTVFRIWSRSRWAPLRNSIDEILYLIIDITENETIRRSPILVSIQFETHGNCDGCNNDGPKLYKSWLRQLLYVNKSSDKNVWTVEL